MRYQVIIPPLLLIPILMTSRCTTSKNESDVIVRYASHAEAEPKVEAETEIQIIIPEKLLTEEPKGKPNPPERNDEEDSNQVIFVPNEREPERNEDFLSNSGVRGDNYMHRRTMDDMIDNGPVRVETESPSQDIFFVSGKNNENENIAKEGKKETYGDTRRGGTGTGNVPKLNCTNLDCNNTIDSVCGGKVEHKQWRYRLFLNQCFFRKVNCYFKHEINRYHLVSTDKCKHIAAHAPRASAFQLFPPAPTFSQSQEKPEKLNYTRRSSPSRRSMSVSVDGKSCSHPCPANCPDDYEPECAVSGSGRRVFINHCKLDYHSCTYGVVWHRRPLSECVGGKKADMRQNRGFIDWMQRVGIVDNKGRLVLS